MKKKEFELELETVLNSVNDLKRSGGVRFDSALYAFLLSASFALTNALVSHLDDYNEV